MNVNQIKEMKEQIKKMQSAIDCVSNEAAGKMLTIMRDTGKAYTGAELSLLTENILTPSQATCAIRAINAFKEQYDLNPRSCKNPKMNNRVRNRRPTTKFHSAKAFSDLNVKLDKTLSQTFAIACDMFGKPLDNAQPKCFEREVTTYQLTKENQ